MIIKKLIIVLVLLTAVPAFAANYYVTDYGAGDNSGSTLENAMTVVQFNALTGDKGGNTYFFSGNFQTPVSVTAAYGNAVAPMILNGDSAIIDHSSSVYAKLSVFGSSYITIEGFSIDGNYTSEMGDALDNYFGIAVRDSNNIKIDNVTVEKVHNGIGIHDNSHTVEITRSTIERIAESGIYISKYATSTRPYNIIIGGSSANGNVIKNCVYKTKRDGNMVGYDIRLGPGVEHVVISHNQLYSDLAYHGMSGILAHSVKNILIEHNTIHGHQSYYHRPGISIKGELTSELAANIIIRFNKIYNQVSDALAYAGYAAAIVVSGNWEHVYIYGNYIYNCGGGININFASWTGPPYTHSDGIDPHNIHVWSNIIRETTDYGITIGGYSGGTDTIEDINISNNTIYRTAKDPDYPWAGIGCRLSASRIQRLSVRNNLLVDNRIDTDPADRIQIWDTNSAINVLEHNTYYHTGGVPTVQRDGAERTIAVLQSTYFLEDAPPDGEVANPGFVNPATGDLRLDGAYVDNGKDLTGVVATITIHGVAYQMLWQTALHPDADWSGLPSSTNIVTASQNDHGSGWERGAYISSAVSPSFDPSGWSSRTTLTVQATEVAENVTGFPVYVDLSLLPAGFHAAVSAGGVDIRVVEVSSGQELAREIVSYDAVADDGELYFLAPSLSATVDKAFYIYAGNSTATDHAVDATYGAQAVWAEYEGVWHLNDLTTSTVKDSSGTNAAGAKTAANQPIEAVGKVYEAQDFTGGDWAITTGQTAQTAYFTLSAFAKGAAPTTGYAAPVHRNNAGVLQWDHGIADARGTINVRIAGNWYYATFGALAADTWYYLTGTWDGYDLKAYKDGTLITTNSNPSGMADVGSDLTIGKHATGAYYFNGLVDEVRLSANARTAGWIETEYNNLSDPATFFGVVPAADELGGALWVCGRLVAQMDGVVPAAVDGRTVTWPADIPDVCDPSHLNLCLTEGDCDGAGGNWCAGACYADACGVGACDVTLQASSGTSVGTLSAGQYTTRLWRAYPFEYAGTDDKQSCKIDLWLHYTGTSSPKNFWAILYTDNAGSPGTQIGLSDATDVSGIGTSEVRVTFDFSTLSSALRYETTYWVGFGRTDHSSSSYANWHYVSATAKTWAYSGGWTTIPGDWTTFSWDGTPKWEIYTNDTAAPP